MESSTILNKNNSLSLKKTPVHAWPEYQEDKRLSQFFLLRIWNIFSLIGIPNFLSFFFWRFLLLGLFFFQVKVGQTQPIQVNLFFNFLQVSKGYCGLWDDPVPAVRGWCTPRKACRFQKRKKCHPRNELLAWYLFS